MVARTKTAKPRRGVCTGCGCTHRTPCVRAVKGLGYVTCAWRDQERTRCTFCQPARRKETR